jgi:Type II secretory pathway, prepilin signal peptidase PulO and related peptidases
MTNFILALYIALFIAISVIDIRTRTIPNRIIYPALLAGLALSAAFPLGLLRGSEFPTSLLFAFLGGLTGFVFLFLPVWKFPHLIGMGDAKLAGLVGFITGFPGILMSLFFAFFTAGVVTLSADWIKKRKSTTSMPFGPFLCAGALITLLWGNAIINLYRGL